MSGVVFNGRRPAAPVVNDRLRTILTNHSDNNDAHLSFPYLGVSGEPVTNQWISFDRPMTDNFAAVGILYKNATATQANRSWIEFKRDSSNNLVVAGNQVTWMLNYPYPSGMSPWPSSVPRVDAVISIAQITDTTVRTFTHVKGTDTDVPQVASVGSSGAMNGNNQYSQATNVKFWGTDGAVNPSRYASLHYLFHSTITNPDGEVPTYTNPLDFYTDINHGTMCLMQGAHGTNYPLFVGNSDGTESTSVDSWHKFLLDNPSWCTCTRYTDRAAFPSVCPSDGNMLAYMRFDVQRPLNSTAYITTTVPSVGLDLSGFIYNASAPNATLHIDLDYAFLFYGIDDKGWIYDNDGYHDGSRAVNITVNQSDTEQEIFSDLGGFRVTARADTGSASIRIRSATGEDITVSRLTVTAKAKDGTGTQSWVNDVEGTSTTTSFTVPVGDTATFFSWFTYNSYVLQDYSKTYVKGEFNLGGTKKIIIEMSSSSALSLHVRGEVIE